MTSSGSEIGKIAKNKLLISAVFAVGIIAALFYSVPAYAFTVANGVGANINGTTTITYNATIYKVTDEAITNVSAKLWQASTMGSTPGKDFVYATSCTPGYYATTDGYSTTGYSPNGYGFTEGGNLGFGYTGDEPSGYGYFYGTGYGYGYTADANAPLFCIFEFKNLDYGVPYTNVTVYINDIAVNTLAMDATVITDYVTIFNNIVTALNTANITTNMASCATTANACENLYFNKTINNGTNVFGGQINFTKTGGLDLTDSATVTFLQSFEDKMNSAHGMVQLNASGSSTFNASGINASITLWGLPNYGDVLPTLTVTYDNGTVSTSASEISGLTYNGAAGTLTFLASHLSKYQMNTPHVIGATDTNVTVTEANSEIIVTPTSPAFTVTVPSSATSAILNLTQLGLTNTSTAITVNATMAINASTGSVSLQMPAGVTISGPLGWDGSIDLPTILSNSSATMSISGFTTSTTAVVEVGLGNQTLTFDKAVRLLIPGMAGKNAAYIRNGVSYVISNCSTTYGDSQTTGDSLGAGAECKMDVGSDMVIWTKHFTQFIAYTQAANTVSSGTSYTYTYTTVTPTPSPQPSAPATETVTPTTTMPSPSPIASPTSESDVTATPQPSTTGGSTVATPTNAVKGDTGSIFDWIMSNILLIIGAIVVIGAAYYFLVMKK